MLVASAAHQRVHGGEWDLVVEVVPTRRIRRRGLLLLVLPLLIEVAVL